MVIYCYVGKISWKYVRFVKSFYVKSLMILYSDVDKTYENILDFAKSILRRDIDGYIL